MAYGAMATQLLCMDAEGLDEFLATIYYTVFVFKRTEEPCLQESMTRTGENSNY
jgi:hypothetical protein